MAATATSKTGRTRRPTSHSFALKPDDPSILRPVGQRKERDAMASLTWLGHSAFLLESDERKNIYIDPFLSGNPKTPESLKQPEQVDVIAVTHGHSDHV